MARNQYNLHNDCNNYKNYLVNHFENIPLSGMPHL